MKYFLFCLDKLLSIWTNVQWVYIWSKNLIYNLTEFVDRNYTNQLGVYQDDLNIGGSGISGGYKGCYGQAHVEPEFKRGDIE